MRLAALALVALLACGGPGWAGQPQYGAYPAEPVYTGRTAPPILDTPDAKAFRTRLRDGVKQPPNFDGHYSFVTWGCGAGCAMGAVVDQVTGKVTAVPFSVCCADAYTSEPDFDYMKFRRDSRLVVFTGKRNEEGPEGRFFYVFEHGRFQPISSTMATAHAAEPSTSDTPVCRDLNSDAERLACYDRQAGR